MSRKDIRPMGRKSDVVVQDYANETLIYDLTDNRALSLNETSAIIWQLCDGTKTITEIAKSVSDKLKSPIDESFVWLALEQLKKENLLENAEEVSTDFGGLSRREVIRKVGFATLVALPLISSLVAPTAVHAVSPATCSGTCRCPDATPDAGSCQGTAAGSAPSIPAGTAYVNCTTVGGASCRCRGPFGPTSGASSAPNALKASTVGCG